MNISLRLAKKKDLMKVFYLSNDDLVRENSFKPNKIKLTDHKKWFLDKLKDKNTLILIAEQKECFVGQIRFKFEKENVIGISISPEFREKGLGSQLITEGLKYVKKTKPEIKKITAYIKTDNIASVKTFEKAGFFLDKELIINKCQTLRYTYND